MSSPSSAFSKIELSPASIVGASESQTPGDVALSTIVAKLSMHDDEQSVKITAGESGSYAIDTAASPSKGFSPSIERYTPPFARGHKSDDVFASGSPSRRQAGSASPSGGKTSRRSLIENTKNWRTGSSSDGDDDESIDFSPSNRTARRLSFGGSNPVPLVQLVRADEAQGVYPPSCCVFVANLLQTEGEETLQMAVTQVFREYGPVFVKIRRDAKQMPFAFCQYTTPEHAERAINEGRGRLIKGRPCRCEKAKAHRLFFVERKFGSVVTPEEVRDLLTPYGNIEFCYTASHVERTALNLNEGVIVQFQLYDDGQNAQSAFRNHDLWKLVAIAGMSSSARAANNQTRSSPTATDTARAYLSRYESDRRSIFVGNLPAGTSEDQIKEIFEPYGKIEEIILRESESKFDPQERLCFAFIQFESVMAVSNILAVKTGFSYEGRHLRISQKDSETGGPKRPARSNYVSTQTTATAYPSPAQQPISPMSMAPPAYGSSPYAYPPFSSPYYYTPGSVYSDGQHYYQSQPPTYPGYYSYAGTHGFDTPAPSTAQVPGSPNTPQSYYGAYAGYPASYQYSPQPYWGMTPGSAAAQPQSSPVSYPPVYTTYSPVVVSSAAADDRSATPTPAGHGATTEDTLESQ